MPASRSVGTVRITRPETNKGQTTFEPNLSSFTVLLLTPSLIVDNDRLLINMATITLKQDPSPLPMPMHGPLRNLLRNNLSSG